MDYRRESGATIFMASHNMTEVERMCDDVIIMKQGRIVAHEKHVLSMKDNNQSANLAALVDAGVRSFKIEGRYKDMGYVKNITAHYRQLLDGVLEGRPGLSRASSGRTTFLFTPDPDRNFNRGSTDYFVQGRQQDIGAFDTPKHAGLPLGWVGKVDGEGFELELDEGVSPLKLALGAFVPTVIVAVCLMLGT